jgi:hypothetical protein
LVNIRGRIGRGVAGCG